MSQQQDIKWTVGVEVDKQSTARAKKDIRDVASEAERLSTKYKTAMDVSSGSRRSGVTALRAELRNMSSDVVTVNKTLKLYNQQLEAVDAKEAELSAARRARDNTQKRLNNATRAVSTAETSYKNGEISADELALTKAKYGPKIEEETKKLAEQKAQVDQLKQEYDAVNKPLKGMEATLKACTANLQAGEATADNLFQEMGVTYSETSKLATAASEANTGIAGAATSARGLAAAENEANTAQAQVTATTTTADNSLKGLLSTMTKYTAQLEAAKKAGNDTAQIEKKLADTTEQVNQRIAEALNFDTANASFGELIQHYNDLKAIDKAIQGTDSSAKMSEQLAKVRAELIKTKGAIKDYETSFKQLTIGEKFEKIRGTISKVTGGIRTGFNAVQRVVTRSISVMRSAVNGFVRIFKSGFNAVGKAINKVKSHFSGMSSSMKSNFKHLITTLTKYVLGFRSLFFLVRRLRKYVGEGIQNLVQFNNGNNAVNRSITELLSSLLFLKNAWAAAFSPIITFVRGWLSMLIDKLAEAGNAVARFIGRLTGQEVVFNAVKVDAQDYAESLDGVGGSASGAADKTKKLTDRLAAFDDLNVLGKDNDPDKTGSGGGGGGADAYTPDPNEMFKIVESGQELLTKLKKMWSAGDFTELGKIISDGLVSALQNIEWGTIQTYAHRIARSIGTFLTGALADPQIWIEAGNAFAQGINTLATFVHGLLTSGDIDFGGNLATLLNTMFSEISWDTVEIDLKMLTDGLIENINSLFANLNDGDLSEGVSTLSSSLTYFVSQAISGINWEEILAVGATIGTAIIDGVIQGLNDSDGTFAQSLGTFLGSIKTAFEEGDPTIAANGLTTFLSNAFANIDFGTLWTNIQGFFGQLFTNIFNSLKPEEGTLEGSLFDTLVSVGETLKNVFSTVMTILPQVLPGLQLITEASMSFINALLPLIEIILPPLNMLIAELTDLISAVLVPVLQILQPVFTAIAMILDLVSPIIAQIVDFIRESTSGTEDLIEPLTELVMAILTPLGELLGPIMHVVGILLDLVISLLDPIMDLLPPLIEMLTACLSPIFEFLGLIGEIIEAVVVPILSVFTTCVKTWVIPILKGLVGVMGAVKDIFNVVTTVINSSITFWKNVFKAFGDWFKGIVNGWIGMIESFVNLLIYGLNKAIGAINKLHFDVPDWVPEIGGGTLGFDIPELSSISIPRLAQGAVIPPNKEFMAVLGDQSNGTNIEAPLDTIKQAVAEVIGNNGNEEMIQLLQQLITVVENKNLVIGDKDIGKANARYVKQQNIVRGATF